jgi:trypsin
VVYEHDGDPTEVGIVSFIASEGCSAGFPAGFTRISEYLDWLEKHAGITIRP